MELIEQELLSEADAARFLNISQQFLRYRRRNNAKIPCPTFIIVDGYRIKYRKSDLEAWKSDLSRFIEIKSKQEYRRFLNDKGSQKK